jgi:hypothetical protein
MIHAWFPGRVAGESDIVDTKGMFAYTSSRRCRRGTAMPITPPDRPRREGCAFTIVTGLLTCVLLVVNGAVAMVVLQFLLPRWFQAASPERMKFLQLLLFVVPVLMIFVEWTAIDYLSQWIMGRFKRRRER